jgi:capsular exopolysaccharide synthesis family protein
LSGWVVGSAESGFCRVERKAVKEIVSQAQVNDEIDYPRHTYTYQQEELHLRDYWKIVVKRRRLVVLCLALLLAFGVYINTTATPLYDAKALLKIEPQNPVVTGVGQVMASEAASTTEYFQTQLVLLRSRTLAERVITDLGLADNPIFTSARIVASNPVKRLRGWALTPVRFFLALPSWFRAKDSKAGSASPVKGQGVDSGLIDHYLSFISVEPLRGTRLIELVATTPDPKLSEQIANGHGTAFIRMNRETRFNLTKEALLFLDTKNTELKNKLEKSEDALNSFRQRYGVVSLDKGENVFVDRLMEQNRQLTLARAQRIEAESLHRMVQDKDAQYLSRVINNGVINQLKGNLAGLEAEKARLAMTIKPDHPRFTELVQQIAEAHRALSHEVGNIVRGIEADYRAARAREDALQAEVARQQQAALKMKEVGVQYAVLQEEVNVNRTLYESVLKRLSETSVSNDVAVSNMQVVEKGETPRFPSSPRKEFNLLFAAALGIFLGVGLAFGLEYFDSSVNNPEAVWRVTAKPTLGTVPYAASLGALYGGRRLKRVSSINLPVAGLLRMGRVFNNGQNAQLLSRHQESIIADSFRTIRTALFFSQAARPPQVILVTSSSPGEGKTVTTLNLAVALAQGGKSVLVIDADLRKGRCHRALGLPNHRGLTDVLTGSCPVQECVWPTGVSGLSLLPRGHIPPYPPDLLGSEKMGEVLKTMRDSYDSVVIDSPPVTTMADAAVLSGFCDGVILVIHGQRTPVGLARQAMERLAVVQARILGVVLNGVDIRNPEYAYYQSYSAYADPFAAAMEQDATSAQINSNANGNNSRMVKQAVTMSSQSDFTEIEPVTGSEHVPQEFFNQMVFNLCKAAGPMAATLLAEKIDQLGETRETFPQKRLKELLERLSQEIVNDQFRDEFLRSMRREIASLAT